MSFYQKCIIIFVLSLTVIFFSINVFTSILKKNISFKRPGTGINPLDVDQIIKKKIKIDLKKNSIIKKTYLL